MKEDSPVVRVPTGRDDTSVVLLLPSRPFDDVIVDFEVHIDAPGLTVRGWTRSLSGDGLDDFVKSLDADFGGWQGVRFWRSMEGDLTIEASHTGHHVALVVSLWRDHHGDAWKVSVPAQVLPGEDLRRFSADVETFFEAALDGG